MEFYESTWKELILEEMSSNGDCWGDIVHVAKGSDDFEKIIVVDYGKMYEPKFTVWTERYVYFPTEYDGLVGVSSVPRDPTDEAKVAV